jgi:hypothetical protein
MSSNRNKKKRKENETRLPNHGKPNLVNPETILLDGS